MVGPTRVTLLEAADILGLSKEAVRKRVSRGTLRSEMGTDGRRYVYLDGGGDGGGDDPSPGESGALISELRAHNDTLREQLEAERQAHAEARRIIAGLVERIPALEAPAQESSERPPPASEAPPGGSAAQPDHYEPAERPERSWWRRFFGG